MFRTSLIAAAIALAATPMMADDVTDTLSSAMQAYEDGDIEYAIEELDYAKQLLKAMGVERLENFLPAPLDGWEREVIESEMNAGMALLGGGVGAEAKYTNGDETFSVSIMADSPMIAMFGGMLSSAGLLGMRLERVGREKFLYDDGDLTGLIDNRILVQASGTDKQVMIDTLAQMDFKALEDFGD